MRLTPEQAENICSNIRMRMAAQSRIWILGSRVDDQRRGYTDLYVKPESPLSIKQSFAKKNSVEKFSMRIISNAALT
jgi:hypothetical protein